MGAVLTFSNICRLNSKLNATHYFWILKIHCPFSYADFGKNSQKHLHLPGFHIHHKFRQHSNIFTFAQMCTFFKTCLNIFFCWGTPNMCEQWINVRIPARCSGGESNPRFSAWEMDVLFTAKLHDLEAHTKDILWHLH